MLITSEIQASHPHNWEDAPAGLQKARLETHVEKQLILEFLDTHWEELLTPLTSAYADDFIPDYMHEFAGLLWHRIVDCRRMYPDSDGKKGDSAGGHLSVSGEDYDSENKGLLGKAETFRRNQEQYGSDSPDSIINENGLFFVQKQTENASLDPAFKKLVDSVL